MSSPPELPGFDAWWATTNINAGTGAMNNAFREVALKGWSAALAAPSNGAAPSGDYSANGEPLYHPAPPSADEVKRLATAWDSLDPEHRIAIEYSDLFDAICALCNPGEALHD